MINQKQKQSIPKKTAEKLSKFDYYIDTLLPDLFEELNPNKTFNQLKNNSKKPTNRLLSKQSSRGIVYNYFYSTCQNSSAINQQSILSSVKKLYLNQDVIKINNMSYSKETLFKQSYIPIYGVVSQIVDFVVFTEIPQKNIHKVQKEKKNEKIQHQTNITKSQLILNKTNLGTNIDHSKTLKTLIKPKQYWIYVIHSCNSFINQSQDSTQYRKINWEYFIERYHFTDSQTLEQNKGKIDYQLIYSYKSQTSSILWNFQQKLTKQFIKSHCKIQAQSTDANTLQTLEKLQGYLLQKSSEVQQSQKQLNDVAFSQEHRRQLKIPIQYFKHYLKLKAEVYKFYSQLHQLQQQSQINKYFYQNLICRYLIARQYHFEQAKKNILQYLKWQKQLVQKYPTLQCFRQIHQIGAYRYIGQDFMGRPVLLNKAALVDVTQMTTQDLVNKYCDYYIYFMQIYLRTKMRGYVDQMVVIGDLQNLSAKNFKLAITKRNLADSLKYGPQRQLCLQAINVSNFAYPVWTFIKPLLPKKTLNKIEIVSNNKKDIIKALTEKMDIKIIPKYLGGQNDNIKDDLKQIDSLNDNSTKTKINDKKQSKIQEKQIQIKKQSLMKKNKKVFQGIDLQKSQFHKTIMLRQQQEYLQDSDSQRMEIKSVQSILIQNKQSNSATRNTRQTERGENSNQIVEQKGFFGVFSSITKILGFKVGSEQ